MLHKKVNNYIVTLCFGSKPEDGGRSRPRTVVLYYDINFNTSDRENIHEVNDVICDKKITLNVTASRS